MLLLIFARILELPLRCEEKHVSSIQNRKQVGVYVY
jgi:hypothetical protein